MRKILIISLILILGIGMAIPTFADESTTSPDDSDTDSSDLNDMLNKTGNSTLTFSEIQTLSDTQSKLVALIATMQGLKTLYSNDERYKGLLNALDQFEKQTAGLDAKISTFRQESSVNGIDGRINSFIKREAALEHKVSIKENLISKMADKTNNSKNEQKNSNKAQKQEENKGYK